MARHAIQQQARLWRAASASASDDVAQRAEEKQVGPSQSSAGGANTSSRRLAFFFLFGAERKEETATHQREKRVQSCSEADTLSCGSCLVEGEAELTTRLSDKRAQFFKMLNSMMMARGKERVEVGGTWVGGGRIP